ncbi:MAG: Flp pilus assembly complex ATPase component TadA [Elusimicrobia bacterium]|nr:Flp pilus assembly complex ATPase component TadA [Elusimicrobiota bacterium]
MMRPLGWDNQAGYRQKKLGEMLLAASLIDEGQLVTALTKQQRSNKKLGEILVNLGYTNEELVLNLLGKQLDSPYIRIAETERIDKAIIQRIPENLAERNLILPVKMEDDTLWVAMSDPANQFLKNVLALLTGYHIKSYIASPKELKQAIAHYYSRSGRFEQTTEATPLHSYFLPLKQLGFTPRQLPVFAKYLEQQKGCLFIIGSEYSGKKTTVYASLRQLNFPDNDIVSVERKMDYKLEGINQLEVADTSDLDLHLMIDSVNQFNPNILAVENIQGVESWNSIGRMAEKGSLVIGTINTDQHILDFLVDFPNLRTSHYSVIEHLTLVAEQKLVRAICPYCQAVYTISGKTARKMGLKVKGATINIYKGKGCSVCNHTGYYGYTACYELLPINDTIKDLIMQKAGKAKLKKARPQEMTSSFNDVLQEKLLKGQVSAEDYLQVMDKNINQFKELKTAQIMATFWTLFERSGSVNAYLQYCRKN